MKKEIEEMDFEEIEDHHPEIIEQIAQEASKKEIKESHALGLETTFIKDGVMYVRRPNGEAVEVKKVEQDELRVKKGTVIYVKK